MPPMIVGRTDCATRAALCRHAGERLAALHHDLRAACLKAHLAPRYAQYLALLLFAHWLDARFSDPTALLARLNDRLLGLGAEKAAAIADHRAPCAELWRRKYPGGG